MTKTRGSRRILIVGADGLRPDLFDPELMPTFASLMTRGTRLANYHAVYPTHTRVNMSTLATGCMPGRHGVVANVMRVEGSTQDGIINTGSYEHIEALDRATGGRAIMVPTLGDILAARGTRLAHAGTGTSGSGILWNRNHPYRFVSTTTTFGRADLYSLRDKLGEPPIADQPHRIPQLDYAARAVTDIFLDDEECEVIVFWMSEPDHSLHYFGLGTPEVADAMRGCDAALARVLDGMDRRGIRDQFDIFLLSDHGHSTVLARRTLSEHLDRARREIGGDFPELTTASDYVYAMPGQPAPSQEQMALLVSWIQEQPWAGTVLGGTPEIAALPGVMPLPIVWNNQTNDRAPLLSISPTWSHDSNEHGVPGTIAALTEHAALRSTHGSASPYELHALGAVIGPDFKEGTVSELPTGAVDITPTVLTLLGIEPPAWIDGRPIWEAMERPAGEPGEHRDEVFEPEVPHDGGFRPSLLLHRVGSTSYFHEARNGRG